MNIKKRYFPEFLEKPEIEKSQTTSHIWEQGAKIATRQLKPSLLAKVQSHNLPQKSNEIETKALLTALWRELHSEINSARYFLLILIANKPPCRYEIDQFHSITQVQPYRAQTVLGWVTATGMGQVPYQLLV